MKIILGIIVVLCSSVSFAQDKKMPQLKSEYITVQARSNPTTIETKTIPGSNVGIKNTVINSVNITAARSSVPQVSSIKVSAASGKTTENNEKELNEVHVTMVPSEKPKNVIPSLKDQKK